MKNTQVIQLMSIVWLSIFMLGITMISCNSKKEQQLPAIGKSVALFDYFSYKGNDDFYISNPLSGEDYFYNPILPGWYSDPSVCTNGEGDYFLVTSTFTYFPGIPIFHSKDLVNWKQIGHVLNRASQLVNMEGQKVSGGIFAPAISYNPYNKTYYMVTTNVGAGNFFVKTQDPFGEWSEPIMYNPQIQISAESETKRSIFREKDKTKRSKKESAQHSKSRNKSFVMTSVSAL